VKGASLGLRWAAKAAAHGATAGLLTSVENLQVQAVAMNLEHALDGNRRVQAHLAAQFALGRFSADVSVFRKRQEWARGLLDLLRELAATSVEAAAKVAAATLAESLAGGLDA